MRDLLVTPTARQFDTVVATAAPRGLSSFSNDRRDRRSQLFVWSVWTFMLLVAFCVLCSYARNIGIAEDWLMVAPLTGHEPSLAKWIWAQNNEHRIPLPRIILLVILKIFNGDFRAGMVLNVLTLAGVAAMFIQTARAARGGRSSPIDAIFPILFLHLGNWENLFWAWQFTFVLPAALTSALIVIFVLRPTLSTLGSSAVAGGCALLLPLCGANGLLIVPLLAPWLMWRAWDNWRSRGVEDLQPAVERDDRPVAALILVVSTFLAVMLCGVYFIGYIKPTWNVPSPSLGASIKTVLKCLAYVWGPIASKAWWPSVLMAILLVGSSVCVGLFAIKWTRGVQRTRVIGLLWLFAILLLIEAAVGHARAAQVTKYGIPIRYVLFATNVSCLAFFLWQLYGPRRVRTGVLWGLFGITAILLPANNYAGFTTWGRWYDSEMDKMEHTLDHGVTPEGFVDRHGKTLVHWWPRDRMVWHLYMLKQNRMGPFVQLRDPKPTPRDQPATQPTAGS